MALHEITIGRLAKAGGVGVETIRYYERRGLLQAPVRRISRYRYYDETSVTQLRFIRKAQALGFTLKEIGDLLELRVDPEADREDVRAKALRKVTEIDEKIADLQAIRGTLNRLILACQGHGPAAECPIIEAFAAAAETQTGDNL